MQTHLKNNSNNKQKKTNYGIKKNYFNRIIIISFTTNFNWRQYVF